MTLRREHHDTVDVPIKGGCTLRLARVRGEDGEDGTLVVAFGYGVGPAFRRPPWSDALIQLPDSALSDVRAALEALEEAEP